MTEFAGQLKKPFVCFRPAVAKKDFARGNLFHQGLREPAMRLIIIEIGNVNEPLRLLRKHVDDFRVGMAETRHGDAASHIEVTLAGYIIHVAASAMAERQIEARISGNDVLLVKRLD